MSGGTQLAWARLILRTLVTLGVRSALFSPGSRSTPLVLAALEIPGLDVVFEQDERVAGFHALGLSRASGAPVLLACTSGSAPAHYFPAVIEATRAGHPLVVLSADRPPELQGREAAQTIDQRELFGRHVKRFFDLGCADTRPASLEATLSALAEGVEQALSIRPGAVHFNLAFRKPFEARGDAVPDLSAYEAPAIEPRLRPDRASVAAIARALREASRPLALLGPARLGEAPVRRGIPDALERLGIPFAAEPASQARLLASTGASLGPAELLLEATPAPDLLLQVGQPPTSGALERFLARDTGARLFVLAEEGHPDPTGHANELVIAPLDEAFEELSSDAGPAGRREWCNLARTRAQRHEELSAGLAADAGRELDDLSAMRCALEAIAGRGYLALGNSLPVRLADLVAPPQGLHVEGVLTQRGAAGIDGLAAGAAGSARALEAPLLLAYGDVSFAHDLGGLLSAARVATPLALLVLDNGGGRIFEELPVHEALGASEAFERCFLTPAGLDMLAAARACGLPADEAHELGELRELLGRALARSGASVVVARIGAGRTQSALTGFKARMESR